MSGPLVRIRRAARRLGLVLLLAAGVCGLAVAAGVVVLGGMVGLARGEAISLSALAPFALLAGVIAIGVVLWLGRGVRDEMRVALWVEERQPTLDYALVTAVQLSRENRVPSAGLLHAAESAEVERIVRGAGSDLLRSALPWLLGVGLGAFLVVRFSPPARTTPMSGLRDSLVSHLTPLTADVTPPAYAGGPPVHLAEPTQVTGLVGSRLMLSGEGTPLGIHALVGKDSLPAAHSGNGWSVTLTLPADPVVLVLRDRTFRRIVTLEPKPDSVPEVVLLQPEQDTSYLLLPSHPVLLEARVADDVGLGSGYWEYLITTAGGGEEFRTETRLSPRVSFSGARTGTLRARLRLDTLHLTPGSVLSIRAVAFDRNDLSGPGRGVSETRTLRMVELPDSSAVGAEPPIPIDSMWLSQRLLNLRADTLRGVRRRLADSLLGSRAMSLSNGQQSVRERVLAVITLLEDDGVGGSSPTDESRLLREAAAVMLDARLALATVQLDSARPPMTRALAILDEIRNARRYHLRGVLRPAPVDVARARLTGTERGEPGGVAPPGVLPDADRAMVERLARLSAASLPLSALRDSVTFLRAEVLRRRPVLAAALDTTLLRLGRGVPPPEALAPARRLLARSPTVLHGALEWQGGGP